MKDFFKRWKQFIASMNSRGVPVPMIRDPKSGLGSVSLTLAFISFNVWLISIIGKAAGALGGIDTSQTMNMVIVCFSLYFGRKFQKDDKGVIVEASSDKEGQ